MIRATVLVVDDDERLRETLDILIRNMGHEVLLAPDVPAARLVLAEHEPDLVISDLRMPGGSGLELLESIIASGRETPVIMLTAFGTVETAVEAMHKGAFDFLLKPFETAEVEVRIERALALRRFRTENDFLREEIDERGGFSEMIGVSPALRRVMDMISQVAPSTASVLVTGETGTGKELVAHAIHRRSSRSERLLVPVNLAAVPTELLESELFGHVRGAFTNAVAERVGRFELAHEGTLFLDEIGDAPLALQPKILRVLQDGVLERVGSNQRREVDVRVISATNGNLEELVANGRFRADLYYRLRVIEIEMPALRARREDIRYLTAHFLRKFSHGRPGELQVTEAALRLLEEYSWPGNIRELENVIQRAVVLCKGNTIGIGLLDLKAASEAQREQRPGVRLDAVLDQVEREMILRALEETKQVKARAARLLGVSERSLWYKMRKHSLS